MKQNLPVPILRKIHQVVDPLTKLNVMYHLEYTFVMEPDSNLLELEAFSVFHVL